MRDVRLVTALLTLALAPGTTAGSEELRKDDERWLALVAPLMLPSERELFERVKKGDRQAFQEIFWARRDDDPKQPKADNAFRQTYLARVKKADDTFLVLGQKGSETDCGVVLTLFGEPTEIASVGGDAGAGARPAEDWTYRGEMFAGGETVISFDESCALPKDAVKFRAQLGPFAEALVRRPALDYQLDEKGRLVELKDRLPKPNAALDLLDTPREDFALETETKLLMRGDQGATYVAGLLRGDASTLEVRERDGRRVVELILAVEARGADQDSVPQHSTVEMVADVDDGGRFVASWPLTLPPGRYDARIAVVEPKSRRGSVVGLTFEAPDLTSGRLSWSPPLLVTGLRQTAGAAYTSYSALTIGTNLLIARFGNEFRQTDQLQLIAFLYDAAVDPSSRKAALNTSFEIEKADGEPISKSRQQVFDTEQSVAGVGPVPLSSFEPGEYAIEMKLEDTVAGVEETVRTVFTVLEP